MNSRPCFRYSDHPRACGANFLSRGDDHPVDGSSPRVRGKLTNEHKIISSGRIIPARAGQTSGLFHKWCRGSDHPRACGANSPNLVRKRKPIGSSPRVRGKRPLYRVRLCQVRIIPARAGQTPKTLNSAPSSTDHPRACGANSPILCENS